MKLSTLQHRHHRPIAEWNPFKRRPKAPTPTPPPDDPYGLNQPYTPNANYDGGDAWYAQEREKQQREDQARQEKQRQQRAAALQRRQSKKRARPGYHVHPDHLHGNSSIPRPFIYTKDGHMLLGTPRQNHMEMLRSQFADPNTLWDHLQDTAIFGRVGNLDSDDDETRDTISFWPSRHRELVEPALHDLLAKKLIDQDSEIHTPGNQSTTVAHYLAGTTHADQDPEAVRKAELARQLHLLPSDQKKLAMKELGVGGGGSEKPNRWRDEMRKAGIPAGSSHHFGTSENIAARLSRIWD